MKNILDDFTALSVIYYSRTVIRRVQRAINKGASFQQYDPAQDVGCIFVNPIKYLVDFMPEMFLGYKVQDKI